MALHSTRKRTPGAADLTGSGRILHWLGIVAMVIGLFVPLFSLDSATATPMSPDRARMMAQQQPLDRDIAGFERIVLVSDFQAQFGCNPFDVNCDQTGLQNNNGFWTGAFPVSPGNWAWELVGVDRNNTEYSLADGQVNIAEGQAGIYAEFNAGTRDETVQAAPVLANVNGPFGTVALKQDGANYLASSINVENDGPVDIQVTIGDVTVPVNTNLTAGSNRITFDANGNIMNVESEGYGEVTINRTDADGNPLPGSCYLLEGASQSRGCDSDDGQADGNTIVRFPAGFEPGNYTLRETTPADGQEALADQQVDIQPGKSTIDARSEGAATGDIVVLRQDADGNSIGGACFEVFDAAGASVGSACDEDGDVPDDGRIGIFDVPAGDVTLRETRTPDGYEPAGETTATVIADQSIDIPVQSAAIAQQGNLIVTRTDANGAPVAGASYALIDANGNVVAEASDDGSGTTTFTSVDAGTYTLRETITPEGNETGVDQQVTIAANTDTPVSVSASAIPQVGNLIVTRTDANGAPVAGASYALIDANGSIVAEASDDGSGTTTFTGVDAGTYTLRETVTPEGNEAGADQQVTITATTDTPVSVSAAAIPQVGNLIVTRTNSDGAPVAGVSYALIDANGNVVAEASDDGAGTTTFTGVDAGTYTLRETVTPEGNEAGADQPVIVIANTDTPVAVSATVIVPPTAVPTEVPTVAPTAVPTEAPTAVPTEVPTVAPTAVPTEAPTEVPTEAPTQEPTEAPTAQPTAVPQPGRVVVYRTDSNGTPVGGACFELVDAGGTTVAENCDEDGLAADDGITGVVDVPPGTYTLRETRTTDGNQPAADTQVTVQPAVDTEVTVTAAAIEQPTAVPTEEPTAAPTEAPTVAPTVSPTEAPTAAPTVSPTEAPTAAPTDAVPPPAEGAALVVTFPYEEGQPQTCIELNTGGAIGLLDLPFGCDNGDNDIDPAAGVIRLENVPAGEYFLDVYQGPDSLVQGDPRPVTIVDDETASVTFEAPEPVETSFVIVTTDGSDPIGGACYQLDGAGDPLCNDGSGTLTVSGVLPGDHTIANVSAPEGFNSGEQQTVAVAADGSTQVTFTLTAATISVVVNTLDAETNEPVPGACYALSGEEQVCDETASGQVVFEEVEPTEHSLTMTTAPEGFEPAAEQLVPAGVITLDVQVEAVTGTINVTVLDENGVAYPNACIAVAGIGDLICDPNGVITVPNLAEGTYAVSLSGDLGPFEAPATQEAVITVEGNTIDLTFTLALATTSVTVLTTDGTTAIGGACYQIDGAGDPVCDDGGGTLTIPNLVPGDHTVTMTTAPAGYTVPEPALQTVTVAADGSSSVTFTVAQATTSLSIQTIDGTTAIGGACYQIDGAGDPVCDDGGGTLTIPNLVPGDHTITMTTAPDGYHLADPAQQSVTVAADGSTVASFTVSRVIATFTITVTDGTNPVGGACYVVDSFAEFCDRGSGSRTARVLPGEHTITMTVVPAGYEQPGPQTVTVATDSSTIVSFNLIAEPINLQITTVDNETSATLPGACYTLDGSEPVCDTGEGVAFNGIEPIERTLVMTTAPDGYIAAGEQTVPAGTTTLEVPLQVQTGSLVVTIVDADNAPLVGTCISIDSATPVCDDDNDGRFEFSALPLGEHSIAVTSVPSGYDLPAGLQTVIVAVDPGAFIEFQIVTTPPSTGGLNVTVRYSDDSLVEGACVTVTLSGGETQRDACDGGEGDTNPEPGIVGFDDLPTGTYEVALTPGSETARPLQTTTPVSATVVAGERAAVTLTLPLAPESGVLTIVTTAGGSNLGGACYTVNSMDVCDNEGTDADGTAGVVQLNDLDPGDYQVSMTTVPGGYEEPGAQSATIVAGETTRLDFELARLPQPGSITVNTSNTDGDPLLNACYAVMQNGTRVASQCDGSPADGLVSLANIPAGNYQLVQTQSPGGQYAPAPTQSVEVSAGEETVVDIVMDLRPGRLTVITADRDEPTLFLQNACYMLVGATEFGPFCDADDGKVDGRVVFTNLPAGQYELRQTSASAGYDPAANRSITIAAGGSLQITVLNARVPLPAQRGTLVVVPLDPNGNPVAGGCYQVFNGNTPVTQRVCDNADDQVGRITFADLPVGKFTLREQLAPSPDWQIAADVIVTIRNGETTTVEVPHLFKTGTVVIQAVNTVGLPLQNACFTLTNAGDIEPCTDASGQATIGDLTPGTRQLTQTKAPFGFKLNTTPRDVVVRPGQTTIIRIVFENEPPPNTGTMQVQKFICPAGVGGERTTFLGGAQGNQQLKQTAGCVPGVASFTLVAENGSTTSNTTIKTNTDGRAQVTAENGIYLLTETDPDLPGNSAARVRVGTGQMTTVIVINYIAPPQPAPVTINVEGYTCAPGFSGSSFVDFQNSCMANSQLTNQITVRAESVNRYKRVTGDTGVLGKTSFVDLPAGTYTIWAERPFSIPLTYLFCGLDAANPTLKAVNGSVVTTQASGTTITCRVFQVPPLFDATHGAIQVQKYNCPIDERQRGYDYKTECNRATESIRFQIQRVDPATKNKAPIGSPIQVTTNGDGIAQFPMLAAGTYKLTEVDGVWCFAQSNSVDSAGDVLVNVNKLSEVWIYNCVGTSEPPNTGSGSAADLLNPGSTPGAMQVVPNLLWPTALLAVWLIRQKRFQA